MRLRICSLWMAAFVWMIPVARAQTGQALARSVVQAEGYASVQPVTRGRPFDVAVVAQIKPMYHINAHKVLDQFLIPTSVETHFPAAFHLVSTDYPSGELKRFSFSPTKLAVYSGRVVFRLKVQAGAAAPLGALDLPIALQYQACNDSMCLPPVKVPLSIRVTVAKAGAPAKSIHPEIFRH